MSRRAAFLRVPTAAGEGLVQVSAIVGATFGLDGRLLVLYAIGGGAIDVDGDGRTTLEALRVAIEDATGIPAILWNRGEACDRLVRGDALAVLRSPEGGALPYPAKAHWPGVAVPSPVPEEYARLVGERMRALALRAPLPGRPQ